jgi:hypothetical protein
MSLAAAARTVPRQPRPDRASGSGFAFRMMPFHGML